MGAGRSPVLTSRRPAGGVRPLDAYPAVTAEVLAAGVAERVELDDTERSVLDAIVEPTRPDRLASSLGVGIREIVRLRMRLELRGVVCNVGGPYGSTLSRVLISGTRRGCGSSGINITPLPTTGMSS